MGEEVFPWLKSLPLAPEYHPSLSEFRDPISYISKIENQASKYGICKIIPPVSASPKNTIISNLNRSLSSQNEDSLPAFTTREQQIGLCSRKQDPLQRSVRESGRRYTLPQFKRKAKNFEKNYLQERSNVQKGLTDLEKETLYWKAQVDKQILKVEYANDMVCSAFDQRVRGDDDLMKQGKNEICDVTNVGESEWNMGIVSRAKGSLLKYLKQEIAGVNTPMIYMGMMFSWFAWHCEDHDLHSLNYMHMGAGKTWYGVPKEAADAFEDVIRTHGYGGEISPLVTFATLVGKTTIMSPEILVNSGVPCCRLVQNAGEFVVTFPRAYHSGFSHGFNCAEATNIATPGWLEVAQDAAIRRALINHAPMVCHSQLLYDQALSFAASESTTTRPEPRSFGLKDRLRADGEGLVKNLFVQDVIQNNKLINLLGNECPATLLSKDSLNAILNSLDSSLGSTSNASLNSADPSSTFSCVTCGISCHACVAIVKPTEEAAHYLMSADLSTFNEDKFEYQIEVPFNSLPQKEDSLRMHIFCLRHAREVQKRLRLAGGVHMLLLCHQDYPKINTEARSMAGEVGFPDYMWPDVGYKPINDRVKLMIKSALDDEGSTYGSQDWAVRLGVNIVFSARLCRTPLYRNQMPYNSVIYNSFCHSSPSINPIKPKTSSRQEKNCVTGKWCGKVWMSNQVHPLLVPKDDEEQKDHATNVSVFAKDGEKCEAVISWNVTKRKRSARPRVHKKAQKLEMDSRDESDYVLSKECGIQVQSKPKVEKLSVSMKAEKNKVIEVSDEDEESEFGCDIDGCNMILQSKQDLMDHKRNICLECGKKFISHNYLVQHRRVHMADRPLKCPWKGCNKTFKWEWARTEHVRVHTGERPYVCTEVGCGQTFRFVSDYSRHKRKTGHCVKREVMQG